MTSRNLLIVLLGNVLLLCGAVNAQPHIVLPGEVRGDELRAAARAFLLKVADGDVDGAKALFDGSADQTEVLAGQFRLLASFAKLQKTLIVRFGDSQDVQHLSFVANHRAWAEGLPRKFIMINGDDACICDGGLFDHGLGLHCFAGQWKVTQLEIHHALTPTLIKFQTILAEAAERATPLVEGGKFNSEQEVEKSMNPRIMEALQLWNPIESHPAGQPMTRPASVVEPASVPSIAEIQSHFGQKILSPEIGRLIATLPGTPRISGNENILYIISKEAGLSFVFRFPSSGLASVNVCCDGNFGLSPYPGELPAGLKFWQTRRSVEKALGRPAQSHGTTDYQYSADYPSRGLSLSYGWSAPRDADNPLTSITFSSARASATTCPATRPAVTVPRVAFRLVVDNEIQAKSGVDRLADPQKAGADMMLLVDREVLLDETSIAEEMGTYLDRDRKEEAISLTFTDSGAAMLEKITDTNKGRQLAIVVDGEILCAPTIQSRMSRKTVISIGNDRSIVGRLHAAIFKLPAE